MSPSPTSATFSAASSSPCLPIPSPDYGDDGIDTDHILVKHRLSPDANGYEKQRAHIAEVRARNCRDPTRTKRSRVDVDHALSQENTHAAMVVDNLNEQAQPNTENETKLGEIIDVDQEESQEEKEVIEILESDDDSAGNLE